MQAFNKATGLPIRGTLETVRGRAEISEDSWTRKPDGTLGYDYAGDTTIWWDEQRTVTNDDGADLFIDEQGNECTADGIVLGEDTAKCGECGLDRIVCCDSGYVDHADGTRTHSDPVCVSCCRGNHEGTPVWDGKTVAGGTFERCE